MSSIASPAAANARFTFALRELIINYGILALLFALIVFFSFAQPAFFRVNNIFSILQAVSITALLGVGVTVTLIAGGFDLSVGGLSAFVQMAAAYVNCLCSGQLAVSKTSATRQLITMIHVVMHFVADGNYPYACK